jgi:hypothetical protein
MGSTNFLCFDVLHLVEILNTRTHTIALNKLYSVNMTRLIITYIVGMTSVTRLRQNLTLGACLKADPIHVFWLLIFKDLRAL